MKVELTPRLVESLEVPPGKARAVFIDTHRNAPRGFALRVYASGVRAYYLLITSKVYGRRWIHLGDASAVGLDAARLAGEARAGEIALGLDPTAIAREKRTHARAEKRRLAKPVDEWTVLDMLRAYVKARRDSLSAVTIREYDRMIKTDIAPTNLAGLVARDVLKDDVRALVAPIGKRSPSVAWAVLSFVRAAFRWAADEEVMGTLPDGSRQVRPRVERDPTRRIEEELPLVRASARRRRKRHLSDKEIVVFWRGVDQLKLAWSTFVRIVLLCGTRRGETYKARWTDVTLDGPDPTWHIPAEVRKGRAPGSLGERRALDVPLSPLAIELLKGVLKRTGHRARVFVADGISLNSIVGEMQRVTGLDVTIHDLRRTTSSGLQRLGAPPHVISVVLGHSRETGAEPSDASYTHDRRKSEHREWLERWASHIEGLLA
jgi:integrase